MIPKILHFIWIGPPRPAWVDDNVARWQMLNPDYDVRWHDETVLLPEWTALYRRISDMCSRSDLLRLSALRRVGGWYFDCDFVPISPMSDLVTRYDLDRTHEDRRETCFLTRQWEVGPKRIANGVLGLTADAPAWDEILEYIRDHYIRPLERTTFGPLMTTHIYGRTPATTVADVRDFYHVRFGDTCAAKYRALLEGDFDEAARELVFGTHTPIAMHLWCGGNYELEVHQAAPTQTASAIQTVREGNSKFCSACHGSGCTECGGGGFAVDQKRSAVHGRGALEAWAARYGFRLTCCEPGKIVMLPEN
jgi:hypothetical protein